MRVSVAPVSASLITTALGYTPSANGTSPSWYDFIAGANAATLPSDMSFTRASAGDRLNSSNVWESIATDGARWQFDSAGVARGLLVEAAQTNSVRNSVFAGAVTGTPGTNPTNMSIVPGGVAGGLTTTIVSVGNDATLGYTAIEIRVQGAAPTTGYYDLILFDTTTGIAASNGQTWTDSAFFKLTAGSFANLTSTGIRWGNYIYDSGGSYLGSLTAGSFFTPTGTYARTSHSVTIANASTAYIRPKLEFNCAGGAVDFTLKIAAPNLVLSSYLSTPIRTSGSATTRAADTPLITNANALADQCWIIKARTATHTSVEQTLLDIGADVNNRRLVYRENSTGKIRVNAVNGGINQCLLDMGVVANDTDFTLAVRWADNNFAASLNGGAIVTDLVGTNPLGMSYARVGHAVNGSGYHWNSTIRTIETRRTASDTELPLLAA